ncbi:hypothetical protein KY284_010152 [Solanum tuberosum]|nr:hypothetical protein KY284_010152 [Solanum tuberosum]
MMQQVPKLQKGRARIHSSGKVVGDPGRWNVVKDKMCIGSSNEQPLPTLTNKFQDLANEEYMQHEQHKGDEDDRDIERNEKQKQNLIDETKMALVVVDQAATSDPKKKIQPAQQHAVEIDTDDSKEEKSTNLSIFKEEKIFKDADLSPRVMKVVKTTRNGKKQGGDFNVKLNSEEKKGELLVVDADYEDFKNCIEFCDLVQVQFKGSPFTWWNGKVGKYCIFERLDRILINSDCVSADDNAVLGVIPVFRCCSIPEVETTDYLFLKGEVAEEIWNHYARGTSSRGNPGLSSTTFCIRDHLGNLVIAKGFKLQDSTNLVAKGFKLQDSTNLVAEARAIREGLMFCMDNMIEQVIIESNSMAMVQILEERWDNPLSVALEVNKINVLRRPLSIRVQHSAC